MGGFFGASAMLWWGLAAAIPILIHLFARQRYKRVNWAAMNWLLRAFKKTRRRIRLEQLLLLLLRILAILLFILALAEPLLKTSSLLGGSETRREVVIVLDDSFSMALQEPDGVTTFSRAKEQALRLVHALRADRGDSVSLITAGRPANLLLKGGDDFDRAAAEVEKIEVGDGSTDFLAALTTVVAALDDLRPGAEIYLLSDLQKVAFAPPSDDTARAPGAATEDRPQQVLASLVQQIKSKQATFFVVPPKEAVTDNLAITSIDRIDKAVITGVSTRIATTIKNFGTRPQRGVVHLYADGGAQPVDVKDLETIAAGATTVADFRHTFTTPGSHTLEARFQTDGLGPDNRRSLALDVRDRIRALVVDGDPKTESGESESFFLASVLDPGADGGRAAFAVDVMEETRFDAADLGGVDLLVLMNVGLISRKRSDDLQRFVEEGGGLLVFLGDRVQAATMNTQLWKGGAGVMPAEILESVGSGAANDIYSFVNVDYGHPALAYFDDPAIRTWLSLPPVYKFFRTRAPEDSPDVRILASFDRLRAALPRAEAAILEKLTGKGRTILVTTAGDQDWNDIPAYPTNVLLVRELAYHLTRRDTRLENLLVGQGYQRTLRSFAKEVVLSRDGEQLQVLRPLPIEGGKGYELKAPPLLKAGSYRLDLSGQPDGTRREATPIHVAVNVDTMESDLTRVGEDYVASSFPGDGIRWLPDIGEAAKNDGPSGDGRGWWWALMLALSALILETALSQVFGLRSRGATE